MEGGGRKKVYQKPLSRQKDCQIDVDAAAVDRGGEHSASRFQGLKLGFSLALSLGIVKRGGKARRGD